MAEATQHHAALQGAYIVLFRIPFIKHVGQIISIGDCSKAETLAYFNERLHPTVPDELKDKLDFETLYDAFGGKLVHWADYIADYSERICFSCMFVAYLLIVNANGNLSSTYVV